MVYLVILKLPEDKKPSDLENDLGALLTKLGAAEVEKESSDITTSGLMGKKQVGTLVRGINEIPGAGIVRYMYSTEGNVVNLTMNIANMNMKIETKSAGSLLLLGFDEAGPYFPKVKSDVESTLRPYLMAYGN